MKKIISLVLVLFLLFSLVACGNGDSNTPTDVSNESSQDVAKENEKDTPESKYAFDEYIGVSQNNVSYQDLIKDMYLSLAKSFANGKLGSQVAIASVHGLVPESVYESQNTTSDKMSAIYKYAIEEKLPLYFEIEYTAGGDPISVDIKLGNLRKFIEDGIECGVFVGTWTSFDLSPQITSLEQISQKMNITNEVAIAFLEMIDSCDIEWLSGNPSNFLNRLLKE